MTMMNLLPIVFLFTARTKLEYEATVYLAVAVRSAEKNLVF